MHIGVCKIDLVIEGSRSLKDRRRVVRSIKDRIKNKFNVSIAEVGELDIYQRATLGIVTISNSVKLVDETLSKVVNLVETAKGAYIADYEINMVW